MFALGLFPFILMFGAKWNIVTFVTGYSHEKLQVSVRAFQTGKDDEINFFPLSAQVFHQWLSHLFRKCRLQIVKREQMLIPSNSHSLASAHISLRYGRAGNTPKS